MKTYSEKLRDPRWQKRRLELLEKTQFTCLNCVDGSNELHIHHLLYERGKNPWDYPDELLLPLCTDCHEAIAKLQQNITKMLAWYPPDFLEDLHSALASLSIPRKGKHCFEVWSEWIAAAKPRQKRKHKIEAR